MGFNVGDGGCRRRCYLFSWWMNLGFPPADASIWVVVIDSLFVALASTGIVSVVTSEWLAKLFGKKSDK